MKVAMEEEEVKEIREEERHLADRLEKLMKIFRADFKEDGFILADYLRERWKKMMLLEEEELDELSHADLVKLREVGVKFSSSVDD